MAKSPHCSVASQRCTRMELQVAMLCCCAVWSCRYLTHPCSGILLNTSPTGELGCHFVTSSPALHLSSTSSHAPMRYAAGAQGSERSQVHGGLHQVLALPVA